MLADKRLVKWWFCPYYNIQQLDWKYHVVESNLLGSDLFASISLPSISTHINLWSYVLHVLILPRNVPRFTI